MTQVANDNIRKSVREQYGKVAELDNEGCCGQTNLCCSGDTSNNAKNASKGLGYSDSDVDGVPDGANMGLGCGNPQAIASLQAGETVLDLGSGGGFDCFLAVKEVGESGRVIGVDMTPEMISKARKNADNAGYDNVEFRLGEIEHLPVSDSTIDVIISNCVINLSPEKVKVYQESFRVLKPGGRLAISDVVASTELTESLTDDMALYTGCLTGVSEISFIEEALKEIGFEKVKIKPKDESREFIRTWVPDSNLEDYVVSATVEAFKPLNN